MICHPMQNTLVGASGMSRSGTRWPVAWFAAGKRQYSSEYGREDLYGGFVGHHRREDISFGDIVANLDKPFSRFRFDGAFARIGKDDTCLGAGEASPPRSLSGCALSIVSSHSQ